MTKAQIIILFSFISIIVIGTVLTITLIFALHPKTIKLKTDFLNLKLGDTCSLHSLVDGKGFKTIINDQSIIEINDGMVITKSYGETDIIFKKSDKKLTLHIKVYADNINFDKNQINLYLNGENNADLTLFVDNLAYKLINFNYDTNIISFDGSKIEAKKLGTTIIKAEVLSLNGLITASCMVNVKQYAFIKNIDITPIYLNINQEKPFEVIDLSEGEATNITYNYDKNYIELENGKIKAKAKGQTKLEIVGYTAFNKQQSYTLDVIIEEKLSINSVKFIDNDEDCSTIMYGKKYDMFLCCGGELIKLFTHKNKGFLCVKIFGATADSDDFVGDYYIDNKFAEQLEIADYILVKNCGAYFEELFVDYCQDNQKKYIITK